MTTEKSMLYNNANLQQGGGCKTTVLLSDNVIISVIKRKQPGILTGNALKISTSQI